MSLKFYEAERSVKRTLDLLLLLGCRLWLLVYFMFLVPLVIVGNLTSYPVKLSFELLLKPPAITVLYEGDALA